MLYHDYFNETATKIMKNLREQILIVHWQFKQAGGFFSLSNINNSLKIEIRYEKFPHRL